MTKQDILQAINTIAVKIFDNAGIQLTEETTARDVEQWDSFNNTRLIVEIEKHFKIRFALSDVMKFNNVGSMCDCILSKLA